MSNININNYQTSKISISKSDYWDFKLSDSAFNTLIPTGGTFLDDNMILELDLNISGFSDNKIYSNSGYTWSGSFNNGVNLPDIGYTGIDNGLVLFDKNNVSPYEFVSILTGSTYTIRSGDTRFVFNIVSGNTGDYIYPIDFVRNSDFNYINFNGGFLQGIFKHVDMYEVLPYQFDNDLSFDILLRPSNNNVIQNTLNSNHIDNQGIFLYMGVRCENKFVYTYGQNNGVFNLTKSGQTSPIGDIGISNLIMSDELPSVDQNMYEILTDNKFLLFNRTKNGLNVHNFDNSKSYSITGKTKSDSINLYNYINRTPTGYTSLNVTDIPNYTDKYDIISDVIRNNICFRITNDNRIGYRMIVDKNCDQDGFVIEEEYSVSGVTTSDEYNYIFIKIKKTSNNNYFYDSDKIKIYFYVNKKLVFVSKELSAPIFRLLNDRESKQNYTPFVLSIGGGTQGLCDMVGFDSSYSDQYLFPIEQYFAGSFIGNIYHFKVFYGNMSADKIYNNYSFCKNRNLEYKEPIVEIQISANSITEPETNVKREHGNLFSVISGNITLKQPEHHLTGYKLFYSLNNDSKIQIGDIFPISQTGGTIPLHLHNVTGDTIVDKLSYEIVVFDDVMDIHGVSCIQEIKFDNMIFFGDLTLSYSIPNTITSQDIRGLNGRAFNGDTNSITLNTGVDNNIFIVSLPSGRTITSVIDIDADGFNVDYTDLFLQGLRSTMVEDGNGVEYEYNTYVMKAGPYSNNHRFVININ